MRFVAGRGAAAERLAGALQRRAIGKLLLAGAPRRSCCWPGRCCRTPSGSNQPGSQRRRPGNAKGQHRTAADAKGQQRAAGNAEQRAAH
ncbi:MAG: hypothetical protein PUI09_02785 [bacterium]|nr:hypothetical protein [bacterium]MDY2650133.1 hypothetical protein [Candidatus Egerieousia sp.]